MNADRTSPVVRGLGWTMAAGVLVLTGWLMTGDAPKQLETPKGSENPPLVLGTSDLKDQSLRKAANALQAGHMVQAQEQFSDIVAADEGSVSGQIGLVLSRWKTIGPGAVERDLEQLAREYPESAAPQLHLGVVRLLARDASGAQQALTGARALARKPRGDHLLARHADDLLHPALPPGYPPLLIRPQDVELAGERTAVVSIIRALQRDDRVLAARRAALPVVVDSTDPAVQTARAIARFSKDDPAAAARLLPDSGSVAERSMLDLHRGLLQLWAADRKAALQAFQRSATIAPRSRWGKQARLVIDRVNHTPSSGQ